jgi:hypothetical protein
MTAAALFPSRPNLEHEFVVHLKQHADAIEASVGKGIIHRAIARLMSRRWCPGSAR